MKLTQMARAKGHFLRLNESGMHLTEWNYPGQNETLLLLWRLQSNQDYTNPNRTLGFDKRAMKLEYRKKKSSEQNRELSQVKTHRRRDRTWRDTLMKTSFGYYRNIKLAFRVLTHLLIFYTSWKSLGFHQCAKHSPSLTRQPRFV